MKWLGENWLRVILATSVLIASLGFVKFLQDRTALAVEVERNRQAAQEATRQDRLAQEKREYVLKKSQLCLAIYETEGKKWSNVRGWRYDDRYDKCVIRYKADKKLTAEECRSEWPTVNEERLACLIGEFEKRY